MANNMFEMVHSLSGRELSVYYRDNLITKSLRITQLERAYVQNDYMTISFEGVCTDLNDGAIPQLSPLMPPDDNQSIIKTGELEVPVYISKYRVEINTPNYMLSSYAGNVAIGSSYAQERSVIVRGIFYDNDFSDLQYKVAEIIDDYIYSRFDILDL